MFKGKDEGYTLVEVLIALGILGFGLLAVATMQVTAIRTNARARGLSQGVTLAQATVVPQGVAFAEGSLAPKVDIARMPGELICFSAIATPDAEVSVRLGSQTIPMLSQSQVVNLPDNFSVLTGDNQPQPRENFTGLYQGCAKAENPGELGKPTFQLTVW